MESISMLAESEDWPVFLLGGMDEKIAEQAAWYLRYKYKNLKIVGHASGGVVEFKHAKWQTSDTKLIDHINKSQAKIIFVGFGCPKQEKWIYQNLDKIPSVKVAMTIGGALDFLAGERKRAIYLLRRLGLEWFWRMITESSHLKRIWNATAVFIWTSIKWRIRMFKYRENAAAFIVNSKDEIFLIKRADTKDDHWQMPQGGVDSNETPEQAAIREAKEETGMRNLEIIGLHPDHHAYEFPSNWHKFNNGYKGQRQNIFYLKYKGDNSDIKLDNREAIDYSWVYIDDVEDMVYERRKQMAKMAVEGYKQIQNDKAEQQN
jgi:exopolysaccharide biosynthesis WecB/TagA/CpsF family protein